MKPTRETIEADRTHWLAMAQAETEDASLRNAYLLRADICDMALAHLASGEAVVWRLKQHPGHSQWSYSEYPPAAVSRTAIVESLYLHPTTATVTHTDHPLRHWDRTCPACQAEDTVPLDSFADLPSEGPSGLVEELNAMADKFESPHSLIAPLLRRAAAELTDETAADLLRDVLLSGVEYDNPRISYVTLQVERETLKEIRAFLANHPPRIDA